MFNFGGNFMDSHDENHKKSGDSFKSRASRSKSPLMNGDKYDGDSKADDILFGSKTKGLKDGKDGIAPRQPRKWQPPTFSKAKEVHSSIDEDIQEGSDDDDDDNFKSKGNLMMTMKRRDISPKDSMGSSIGSGRSMRQGLYDKKSTDEVSPRFGRKVNESPPLSYRRRERDDSAEGSKHSPETKDRFSRRSPMLDSKELGDTGSKYRGRTKYGSKTGFSDDEEDVPLSKTKKGKGLLDSDEELPKGRTSYSKGKYGKKSSLLHVDSDEDKKSPDRYSSKFTKDRASSRSPTKDKEVKRKGLLDDDSEEDNLPLRSRKDFKGGKGIKGREASKSPTSKKDESSRTRTVKKSLLDSDDESPDRGRKWNKNIKDAKGRPTSKSPVKKDDVAKGRKKKSLLDSDDEEDTFADRGRKGVKGKGRTSSKSPRKKDDKDQDDDISISEIKRKPRKGSERDKASEGMFGTSKAFDIDEEFKSKNPRPKERKKGEKDKSVERKKPEVRKKSILGMLDGDDSEEEEETDDRKTKKTGKKVRIDSKSRSRETSPDKKKDKGRSKKDIDADSTLSDLFGDKPAVRDDYDESFPKPRKERRNKLEDAADTQETTGRRSSFCEELEKEPKTAEKEAKDRKLELKRREREVSDKRSDNKKSTMDIYEVGDAQKPDEAIHRIDSGDVDKEVAEREKLARQRKMMKTLRPRTAEIKAKVETRPIRRTLPGTEQSITELAIDRIDAATIRESVYLDWYAAKMEMARREKKEQREKEEAEAKKKEEERKEKEMEKKLAFESWKNAKKESGKIKKKDKTEEEKKAEEEEKKRDAKLAFEKWKEDKNDMIRQKQEQEAREKRKKTRDEKEKKKEKKTDSAKAFESWSKKKDEVIKQGDKERKAKEKQKEKDELEKQRQRELEVQEAFQRWEAGKDHQGEVDVKRTASQTQLLTSRRAWRPSSSSAPRKGR